MRTFGHACFTRLDEAKIVGNRSAISFAEFVMVDDAGLGQMADYGPVAFLTIVSLPL